jgi:endonuclease/exonuclease/phosphatase (EEP) superfamily protein YafD
MRKVLRFIARIFPWVCTVMLLLLSLAGVVPRPTWYVDNVAQLRLPLLIAVVALLLACLPLRRNRLTAALLAILIIDLLPVASLYLPPSTATSGGSTIKVVSANTWGAHNLDQSAFESLIRAERPDLFILIEMTPAWLKALKRDLPEYSIEFGETLSGGTAIFSKIPIREMDMRAIAHKRRFGARGVISIDGTDVLLIGSHPPAPSEKTRWQVRNAELQRLAEDVRREIAVQPVVIAGDLNTTPWSYYFQHLCESGLRDSEQGLGPQPSWSKRMPLPLVPIDHVLYTEGVVIRNRRLGPDIGSDHLPVIFEIARTK